MSAILIDRDAITRARILDMMNKIEDITGVMIHQDEQVGKFVHKHNLNTLKPVVLLEILNKYWDDLNSI